MLRFFSYLILLPLFCWLPLSSSSSVRAEPLPQEGPRLRVAANPMYFVDGHDGSFELRLGGGWSLGVAFRETNLLSQGLFDSEEIQIRETKPFLRRYWTQGLEGPFVGVFRASYDLLLTTGAHRGEGAGLSVWAVEIGIQWRLFQILSFEVGYEFLDSAQTHLGSSDVSLGGRRLLLNGGISF